ncbi:MAG: hypothetical protein ACJATU_000654 [Rickettsiales bacterium]|jgi:hypothetical protein
MRKLLGMGWLFWFDFFNCFFISRLVRCVHQKEVHHNFIKLKIPKTMTNPDQFPKISLFKGKKIRKTIHQNEWWFSVIDVVSALTESINPRDYWFKIKIRVKKDDNIQLSTICRQLKLEAEDGKMRETDCANTEGIFRIIQSIPSPKAEPFKRWLAKVGYERIQEIEDPELASKRTRALYKLKGYSDDWIEKRMRGIVIRE